MFLKYLSLYNSFFTVILYTIFIIISLPFLLLLRFLIFYLGNLELLIFFNVFIIGKIVILVENEINYCENLIKEIEIEREEEGKK